MPERAGSCADLYMFHRVAANVSPKLDRMKYTVAPILPVEMNVKMKTADYQGRASRVWVNLSGEIQHSEKSKHSGDLQKQIFFFF